MLDASALVALLWDEPGGDAIEPLLGRSVMSAVNWAEVLQRYRAAGLTTDGRHASIEALGVSIVPFTSDDADVVAALWKTTTPSGLALADRACFALAKRLDAPAYTADRAWGDLDVGAAIVLIR